MSTLSRVVLTRRPARDQTASHGSRSWLSQARISLRPPGFLPCFPALHACFKNCLLVGASGCTDRECGKIEAPQPGSWEPNPTKACGHTLGLGIWSRSPWAPFKWVRQGVFCTLPGTGRGVAKRLRFLSLNCTKPKDPGRAPACAPIFEPAAAVQPLLPWTVEAGGFVSP